MQDIEMQELDGRRRIIGDVPANNVSDPPSTNESALVKSAEKELAVRNTEGQVLDVLKNNAHLSPQATNRLRRLAVARMASDDIDRSVEHFLTPFSKVIKPNPRAMKRRLNSYTIFRDLALLGNVSNALEPSQRAELARGTILCMDAPVLLDFLEERPELLNIKRGHRLKAEDVSLGLLWLKPRIQDLLYGFSNEYIDLGELRPEVVIKFSPLRG
jgi:hypothetical protein